MPARFGVRPGEYVVLTLHPPSNVDEPATLERILRWVADLAQRLPVVFPVHPRTGTQILAGGLQTVLGSTQGLIFCDPLGYLEFLSLSSRARLVLTDSGGLQEESTALGIPYHAAREYRAPTTIEQGTNVLVGTDPHRIEEEAIRAL